MLKFEKLPVTIPNYVEQLTLIRIFEELRGRGYDGGYDAVRRFADLPRNAQRYTAAMLRALIEVAYPAKRPAALPNLRSLGVGPAPSQIIKDVPATAELIRLA